MKRVKFVILFFVLLTCILMNGEIAQNNLDSVTNELYYFCVAEKEITNRHNVCSTILELCDVYDCDVFCTEKQVADYRSSKLIIYATDECASVLHNSKDVQEGIYNSFFSGETEVSIKSFMEVVEKTSIERFFLMGESEQIRNVRNRMNEEYATSYIHKDTSLNNSIVMCTIWGIAGLFYLLLTWYDIQFQKKENFILISMGKEPMRLAVKNILIDIILFSGIYWGMRILFGQVVTVDYLDVKIIPLILLIQFINSLLYLSLLRLDYKQVLYGANLTEATLSNCYVLKAISAIIVIIVLAINISLLTENAEYLRQYEKLEIFEQYKFVTLERDMTVEDPEEIILESTRNLFYAEQYNQEKVAFSVSNYVSDIGHEFILCNSSTINLFNSIKEVEKVNWDKDIHILIPFGSSNVKQIVQEAKDCISGVIGRDIEELSWEEIMYEGNYSVLYFDSHDNESLTGFAISKNPIIVICSVPNLSFLEGIDESTFSLGNIHGDIMYQLTNNEIDKFSEQYQFKEKGIYAVTSPVMKRCESYKTIIERTVLLNSVLSVFLLILELLLISAIIKMEFIVSANELALKKILGYSLFERNQLILLLNVTSLAIGLVTAVLSLIIYRFAEWYLVLGVGMLLIFLEMVFLLINIRRMEKESIPKILKGGCL